MGLSTGNPKGRGRRFLESRTKPHQLSQKNPEGSKPTSSAFGQPSEGKCPEPSKNNMFRKHSQVLDGGSKEMLLIAECIWTQWLSCIHQVHPQKIPDSCRSECFHTVNRNMVLSAKEQKRAAGALFCFAAPEVCLLRSNPKRPASGRLVAAIIFTVV